MFSRNCLLWHTAVKILPYHHFSTSILYFSPCAMLIKPFLTCFNCYFTLQSQCQQNPPIPNQKLWHLVPQKVRHLSFPDIPVEKEQGKHLGLHLYSKSDFSLLSAWQIPRSIHMSCQSNMYAHLSPFDLCPYPGGKNYLHTNKSVTALTREEEIEEIREKEKERRRRKGQDD